MNLWRQDQRFVWHFGELDKPERQDELQNVPIALSARQVPTSKSEWGD